MIARRRCHYVLGPQIPSTSPSAGIVHWFDGHSKMIGFASFISLELGVGLSRCTALMLGAKALKSPVVPSEGLPHKKKPAGRDTGGPLVRLPAHGLLRFRRHNLMLTRSGPTRNVVQTTHVRPNPTAGPTAWPNHT